MTAAGGILAIPSRPSLSYVPSVLFFRRKERREWKVSKERKERRETPTLAAYVEVGGAVPRREGSEGAPLAARSRPRQPA